MALIAAAGFVFLYRSIDIPDPNSDFETQTTKVFYADGKDEIGSFAVQNREVIGIKEMPENLQNAVVAAENRSFWTDKGLDPKGMLRAFLNNASSDTTQGASTITQQYVKILYLSQERTYKRKVKEAVLSLKIQRSMSKTEILAGLPQHHLLRPRRVRRPGGLRGVLRQGRQGPRPARVRGPRERHQQPDALRPGQRQGLQGGAQGALRLRARRHGRRRQHHRRGGREGREEAAEAPEDQSAESRYAGQKGHVLTMVRKELLRLGFKDDEIDGGGLRVTTTFTEKAMNAAEEGVAEARPEGLSDKELHVGVASVEPGTGAVRGIFGGQDYLKSQLNWAVAGGQAGSTLKPFALVAAIRDGFSLKDTFDGNSPYILPDGGDVENQGNESYGSAVSMIKATEDSINTAFIDMTLGMENGPEKIIKAMNDMGLPGKEPTQDLLGFPMTTPGSRAGHRRRARQRDREPDQHGERLRHPGRERRGRAALHHREGRRPPTARCATTTRWTTATPSSRTSPPTSPTRCSRS